MRSATLEILRCPYCGGRLELVEALPHRSEGGDLSSGILGCHCCTFPVVSGIPVMHLEPWAVAAREAIEADRVDEAERVLLAPGDEARGKRFQELSAIPTSSYRELVEALGPAVEGGYFLYRFSDPTYLVARAVIEAVAGTVLERGGRAIDVCGGSGHLTRSLLGLSSEAPVIADLYFAKLWLARRFLAPTCEPVCCDANAPLPFARGSFDFAVCSDIFHYIWTKRRFVSELVRLIEHPGPAAVVISHLHNERQWSPSFGQPLPPEGYRDLFEALTPRLFSESGLLADVIAGGPLDLARRDDDATLDADPALTIVASRHEDVYRAHPLEVQSVARGELRLNPLYASEVDGDQVRLRLVFPSPEYEDEYGDCRRYLPEELVLDLRALDALVQDRVSADPLDLVRRRVVLDLPRGYY